MESLPIGILPFAIQLSLIMQGAKMPLYDVSRRVRHIPHSATKQMPVIAAQVGDCVSLGQGVPSFPTPDHIIDAVCETLRTDHGAGKYSLQQGLPQLRRAIAGQLRAEKNLEVDPDTELAVTAGAMEALLMATLTLVGPGDEVLLPSPYYPSHVEQVLLAEGTPVAVPLKPEDWSLDIEAMRNAVTSQTKVMIINSPHNPTGAVFSREDLMALAELAVDNELYVICDDTYDSLTYEKPGAFSLATIPELRPRLIAVNSFSKRYALTGWRAGYIMAPADILGEMLKVHDCSVICAPTPAQHAALAALQGPQQEMENFRLALDARRQILCKGLDALAPLFSYVPPKGAFYIMARCDSCLPDSRELAIRLIREARVITIPGGAFGPGGERHLRMSFGSSEEEITEALSRIKDWARREGALR